MTDSILERLKGEQLLQVWFVTDYLQLIFGVSLSLQCFVWPTIRSGPEVRSFPSSGYRDALCDLIMKPVSAVEENDRVGLVIDFGCEQIVVSPNTKDLIGPEIALFSELGDPSSDWQVWQPGDETFPSLG
jgi:hypothetical protein